MDGVLAYLKNLVGIKTYHDGEYSPEEFELLPIDKKNAYLTLQAFNRLLDLDVTMQSENKARAIQILGHRSQIEAKIAEEKERKKTAKTLEQIKILHEKCKNDSEITKTFSIKTCKSYYYTVN